MSRSRRALRRSLARSALELLCLAGLVAACASSRPVPATLLLRGGVVHTVDPALGQQEALAVRDGSIVWVGSDDDSQDWIGQQTRVIELQGRCLLPGFADSHLHLGRLADMLGQVDLVGTHSYAEVIERTRAQAARQPKGSWVLGRGWDQNDWPDPAFPHHAALSEAVPDHPVALTRIDGHALLANRAALQAARIRRGSRSPDGGRILVDAEGAPTGVLVDDAMEFIQRLQPGTTTAERREHTREALAMLQRSGITSLHDAGTDEEHVALYADMARAGEFRMRAHIMIDADTPGLATGELQPSADLTGQGLLALRAIKLTADGALGSRGAALLDDYSDEPGQRGLTLAPYPQVLELTRFALRNGWQLATHAIGDRANRLVLDAYAVALGEAGPGLDARLRIEHAQVLHPDDIPRFAALGVLPSMQAQHLTSDMPWAEQRLGPARMRGAYAWRALLDQGSPIPGGSDAPVEVPDPLLAFHAAVSRQDAAGQPPGGCHPEQCMTRLEALRHLTLWPAYAAFQEERLGSLTPGKRADLVVLSGDPLALPVDELTSLQVDLTVFDGDVVYERNPPPPPPAP